MTGNENNTQDNKDNIGMESKDMTCQLFLSLMKGLQRLATLKLNDYNKKTKSSSSQASITS
jgi:hypothetical protein